MVGGDSDLLVTYYHVICLEGERKTKKEIRIAVSLFEKGTF